MPSDLLKCIICPKKPTFSDVSHLLTHVGSKGHLAHVHGLQVRSHQELDAGHQLAIYNQWYQEHGVAGLLSERLQQKEQKKAIKKSSGQAQRSSSQALTKSRSSKHNKNLPTPIAISAYDAQPPALKSRTSDDAFDMNDFTPVRSNNVLRETSYPVIHSSPLQDSAQSAEVEQVNSPVKDEPETKTSPGTPQLKGTVYPGMDLFDAAPEEQRKKRNQKKDSSVLRKLERNATMVEPTETVTSASGTVLKHRHMDNLEDDEPVEGEETFRLPTPKRHRSSAPRRQRPKQQVRKSNKGPGRPRRQIQTPKKAASNVASSVIGSDPHFSPGEDEIQAFDSSVHKIKPKKRKRHVVIYEDLSPSFGGDGASESMHYAYADVPANQQQLSYPPPLLQRRQEETYDPFKLTRDRFTPYASLDNIEHDNKENANPLCNHASPPAHVNPLFFDDGHSAWSVGSSFIAANHVNPIFSSGMDPFHDNSFTPVRNPLMSGLDRCRTPTKQESFGFGGVEVTPLASQYRQPLFAP